MRSIEHADQNAADEQGGNAEVHFLLQRRRIAETALADAQRRCSEAWTKEGVHEGWEEREKAQRRVAALRDGLEAREKEDDDW